MADIKRVKIYKIVEELPPGFEEEDHPDHFVNCYRLEFDQHPTFVKMSSPALKTYMTTINTRSCVYVDSIFMRFEVILPNVINPADATSATYFYRNALPKSAYAPRFGQPISDNLTSFILEVDEEGRYSLVELPLKLVNLHGTTILRL